MSRCFPFPPPGYEKTNSKDEAALTESIKRERDRADKERRKEKKREKKERKKEKKEKSKIKEEVEKKTQSHKDEGTNTDLKFVDHQKRKNYEIEQLERSGLSEEHGEPNSVQKVCDSSDSTQNSGKRKRHNSPFESQTQSTMFRIRLPLGKHRDSEEHPSKEQLCSSSRSTKHEDQQLPSGGKVCSSRGDKHRNLEDQLSRDQLSASARSANNHKVPKELPNTGKPCLLLSGSKPRDPEQFSREQPCSSARDSRGLDEVVRREPLCSPPSGSMRRNFAELPSKEHICSSSGKNFTTEKKMADNGPGTGTLNHKMDAIAPSSSIKRSCSIKGKAEVPPQDKSAIAPSSSIKQSCSIKGKAEVPPHDKSDYAAAVVKLGLCGSGSLSDVQLRNLVDNWVPPPIQAEPNFDDQEWLFDIPPRREPKRAKVIDGASCNERTSLWPRACYLPEAEIYALPYTVPF